MQSDAYNGIIKTVVVAEVTKNLTMASNPACLLIGVDTPEGRATGLVRDSVVSCLLLATIDGDRVDSVLGSLSSEMVGRINDCIKAALSVP